ncbi:hypothetical protein bthur0007_56530 [Bacillus thuringiensis serovar monterrey BGSC 4AJ1]|nr:hypothetical protein bthur0007_56530 [Bacillus thuringiensis serovar monterrey BGSC 4AJ1]
MWPITRNNWNYYECRGIYKRFDREAVEFFKYIFSAEDNYLLDEKPNVFSVVWIFSISPIAIMQTIEKIAD